MVGVSLGMADLGKDGQGVARKVTMSKGQQLGSEEEKPRAVSPPSATVPSASLGWCPLSKLSWPPQLATSSPPPASTSLMISKCHDTTFAQVPAACVYV